MYLTKLGDVAMLLLVVVMRGVDPTINEGPKNSLMNVTQSVELKCRTGNAGCTGIDWKKQEGNASPKPVYQDGPGMLNPDQFPAARYSVSTEGGCTLKITNLILGDSGKFICIETANGGQDTKSAVLVVIGTDVKTCENNASTEVVKGDSYVVQCVVSVPPRTTEPTNVNLTLYAGEEATLVASSSSGELQNSDLTVSYTAIAEPPMVPKYQCRASFSPERQPNYDNTTAKLDVCKTDPNPNVLYEATNIRMSREGKVYSGDKCIADGNPSPEYMWRSAKTGNTWKDDAFTAVCDEADTYTCTANNTVKGKQYSVSIDVTCSAGGPPAPTQPPSPVPPGAIAAIVIIVIIIGGVIVLVVLWYILPRHCDMKPVPVPAFLDKKEKRKTSNPEENLLNAKAPENRTGTGEPKPTDTEGPKSTGTEGPPKPKRASENQHHQSHRPDSYSYSPIYAEVQKDPIPHRLPAATEDTTDTTDYVSIPRA